MKMKMPAGAISDHMSRLYKGDTHIDRDGAVIKTIRTLKNSVEIEISEEAILDFIDDMAYQIEFNEGRYQSVCKYAFNRMNQQRKTGGEI